MANVNLDTIVEALIQAPTIAREVAPMSWMFLDAPRDGSVMLVWQALSSLGTRSASDGYVWADPEQAFSQEHKGYIVEMYVHRSGYAPGKESETAHSRRRYRLTPSPNGNPNQPPCDPALWLLHYMPSEPNHRFPANRVPVPPAVNVSMQQRTYLQRYGQLIRKDFMLHDRSNWPIINVPNAPQQSQPAMASGYPGNVIQHLTRGQQPGYPAGMQQPGSVGPSPAKRQRQMVSNSRTANTASVNPTITHDHHLTLEEEDVSRGDLMDFLTPRDISTLRYTQHHEWVEEIFSSPYATSQIIPMDLGLGRKGELEALTNGFFDAPVDKIQLNKDDLKDQQVQMSRLGPERAEEFAQRATEKLKVLQAEMDKMKARHERRMSKIGKHSPIYSADKRLQKLNLSPSDTGSNPVQPGDTPPNDPARGAATISVLRQFDKINEIAGEVELKLGRQIQAVNGVTCVEKGGLEEKTEAELRQDQALLAEQSNHGTPPLLNQHANVVPSINAPTDYSSNSASNQPSSIPTPKLPVSASITPPVPATTKPQETSQPPPDDWVMVDQPPTSDSIPSLQPTTQSDLSNLAAATISTSVADFPDTGLGAADNFSTTPLANDDVFGDINFDGMDTAGDELANFEGGNADDAFAESTGGGEDEIGGSGEMVFATETGDEHVQAGNSGGGGSGGGDEENFESAIGEGDESGADGDMVMEDSAFGDAFLNTEPVEGDGGTEGDEI